MNRRRSFLLLPYLFASACGDSEDELADACAPVVACGGDVVGTWRIESNCSTDAEAQAVDTIEEELPPECSGALVSAESQAVDVSLTFDAQGMVAITGSTALRLEYTFDAACLAALSPALGVPSDATCTELGPDMMGAMPASSLGSTSCAFEDGACACEYSFQPDVSASSSYTLADNRITIDEEVLPYCVSGDELRLGLPPLGTSVARRQ